MFKASAGIMADQTDNDTTEDTLMESIKQGSASSTGLVTNSGSTNTGKTSTVNSGSVNTSNTNTNTSGSTKTDGSVNTTVNSGSVNTVDNSGSVNTSQLMLAPEAVDHITRQLLEGTQGLTAVARGQKTAGGYDATANTMLTNDLLSRITGEVAARQGKTVNTIGASSSVQNIGGSSSITNIGGTNSTTSSSSSASGTQILGGSTSESNTLNIIGGSTASTQTDTTSMEHILGATASNKQQDIRETKEEAKTEGGWIVCTELVRQGRMSKRHYYYGLQVFKSYDARGKRGYYYWAVPALIHLRTHPTSKLSKFLEVIMCARAEHLAAEAGCKSAKKSALGWITKHGLYAICWTLSRTLARSYSVMDAKELHTQGAANAS